MADQGEMRHCVQRYLTQLSPGHQEILTLRDVEGRSTRDTAATLGISEGAAKIRLHRARTALRELHAEACASSRDDRGVFVCEPRPDSGAG